MSIKCVENFQRQANRTLIFAISAILAMLVVVIPRAQGSRQEEKERSVQIKVYKEPPAAIAAIRVKGTPVEPGVKFVDNSDWLNGLTVTLKNVSDRPIAFVTVAVIAPHKKNGVQEQVDGRDLYEIIELKYGEPPPAPGKAASTKPMRPLMPGDTADVILEEKQRDELYSHLRLRESSTDISEVTLSVFQLTFLGDNDTLWMHGLWRKRDPIDPMRWVTIDSPPQRNHADRKPRFLGALNAIGDFAFPTFSSVLDSPPRCTLRDIGPIPTDCTAIDTAGLRCRWQDQTLLASGYKNVVPGVTAPKYCFGHDNNSSCPVVETHLDTTGDPNCTAPLLGQCGGPPDFGTYPSRGCMTGLVFDGDACNRSVAFQSRCADPSGYDPITCSCPDGTTMSPIVIDIDESGFSMTDATHGVVFDILNDGVPLQVSWTSATSTNAFLALDRNGNGKIDSGKELFGNLTPQPPSQDANGFLALAEFDKPQRGGNRDGVISKNDAIFNSLRLWQDNNHNGVSEASELHGLQELGAKSIDLEYRESRRVDQYGNRFRYRAKVRDAQDSQLGRWAWDVFLLVN